MNNPVLVTVNSQSKFNKITFYYDLGLPHGMSTGREFSYHADLIMLVHVRLIFCFVS